MNENLGKLAPEGETLPLNVKMYFGQESLPPGSIVSEPFSNQHDPLDALVKFASEQCGISTRSKAINTYLKGSLKGTGAVGLWFGSLVSGMQDGNKKSFLIARKMSEIAPNLAWMRGGSLRTHNGIAIIDGSGRAGVVGGGVEEAARSDFYWQPREKPTIYRIDWSDIVEAAAKGLFRPGTEHCYDFNMTWDITSPEALEWQARHLTAYLLDESLLNN